MYTVINNFADKFDTSIIYKIGAAFKSEDADRINDLLNRKLIEGAKTASSFDVMTKKEVIQSLKERGIEFNERQSKDALIEILKGCE